MKANAGLRACLISHSSGKVPLTIFDAVDNNHFRLGRMIFQRLNIPQARGEIVKSGMEPMAANYRFPPCNSASNTTTASASTMVVLFQNNSGLRSSSGAAEVLT
jgi:hypothetical protein